MKPVATCLLTSVFALVVLSNGRVLRNAAVSQRASLNMKRTVEPFPMNNKTFLKTVQDEVADIAVLFYSPTCPDCQWFFDRWAAVGQKLQKIPSMVVWTVADPNFTAPGAFNNYWHHPDIFFVPAKDKSHPLLFPEKRILAFLAGDVKRPQAVQDEEFEDHLVDWFGQHSSWPLNVQEILSPESVKAQQDLEALALKEWKMLQARWNSGLPTEGDSPSGSTLTTVADLKKPKVESPEEQRLEDYANSYVATFLKNKKDSKYSKDYLYKYAVAYYRRAVYAGVKHKTPQQAVPMPDGKDLSLLKNQAKLHL